MNKRVRGWKEKLTKENMAVFALAGLLLMVIALPVGGREEKEDKVMQNAGEEAETRETGRGENGEGEEAAYAAWLEERLSALLSEMEGVGRAEVMVTLASFRERVVEKDVPSGAESVKESDSEGGTRESISSQQQESTVYVKDSAGNQTPYVAKVMEPSIEGVTVVAQGGGDARIQKDITEVIEALFGIEAHKIKVVKMK